MDNIIGVTEENFPDIGKVIKCMEKGYFYGLMEENIKDNISMIKNKDMDNFIGQMEDDIKVIGKMGNSMD